jgi:Fe-Mn family superoxide dismutase
MIQGTEKEDWDVIRILREAHGKNQALFNNAGQSFNHEFYWNCMKPNGGGVPSGRIGKLITDSFGSYDAFRSQFVAAGMGAFGSGWAWLVWTPTGLKITNTIGAESPLTQPDQIPLLTMDVWEHAYYLKYRNMRVTYCDVFVDHLINWEFVESQLPK